MSYADWVVTIAMLVAPLLAIQVQKFIEVKKETYNRKLNIFKALMATRATPIHPTHVEALNMICIEFHKEKRVIDVWQLLYDNFDNFPNDPGASDYTSKLTICSERSKELLTELLYEMSKILGYDFDKVILKRGCYIPKGHGDFQLEHDFIRRSIVELFLDKKTIPISIGEVKRAVLEETTPKK